MPIVYAILNPTLNTPEGYFRLHETAQSVQDWVTTHTVLNTPYDSSDTDLTYNLVAIYVTKAELQQYKKANAQTSHTAWCYHTQAPTIQKEHWTTQALHQTAPSSIGTLREKTEDNHFFFSAEDLLPLSPGRFLASKQISAHITQIPNSLAAEASIKRDLYEADHQWGAKWLSTTIRWLKSSFFQKGKKEAKLYQLYEKADFFCKKNHLGYEEIFPTFEKYKQKISSGLTIDISKVTFLTEEQPKEQAEALTEAQAPRLQHSQSPTKVESEPLTINRNKKHCSKK